MFILFYVAQIFHGPRFIYWTCFPIFLYILERVLRVTRGRRTVYVKAVRWIDPVMCIELMPKDRNQFKFIEGQYIYLNCPYLSPNEVSNPRAWLRLLLCAGQPYTCMHAPDKASLLRPPALVSAAPVAPLHHFLGVRGPHVRRPRPHGAHPSVPQGLDGPLEGVLRPHEPAEPVRGDHARLCACPRAGVPMHTSTPRHLCPCARLGDARAGTRCSCLVATGRTYCQARTAASTGRRSSAWMGLTRRRRSTTRCTSMYVGCSGSGVGGMGGGRRYHALAGARV